MKLDNAERANALVEALPYLQRYAGRTIVVKYGGNAMTDANLQRAVMRDAVLLSLVGVRVVLVHGGGPQISEMIARTGLETKFSGGLRVTDKETMRLVKMVLAGEVNKDLVGMIASCGGRAVGICGADGGLFRAQKLSEELGFVGKITHVDPAAVNLLLDGGYIPIVASVGADEAGNAYNINADTAASALAGALRAEGLIVLTDTPGLLQKSDDPSTLIRRVTTQETKELIASGVIRGGMIPKIEGCVEALEDGVSRVFIIDGRVPHALLIETLTDEGLGTMIEKS